MKQTTEKTEEEEMTFEALKYMLMMKKKHPQKFEDFYQRNKDRFPTAFKMFSEIEEEIERMKHE